MQVMLDLREGAFYFIEVTELAEWYVPSNAYE